MSLDFVCRGLPLSLPGQRQHDFFHVFTRPHVDTIIESNVIWGYRLPQDAASRKTSLDLSVGERGHISVVVVCVFGFQLVKNFVYVSKNRVFLFFSL